MSFPFLLIFDALLASQFSNFPVQRSAKFSNLVLPVFGGRVIAIPRRDEVVVGCLAEFSTLVPVEQTKFSAMHSHAGGGTDFPIFSGSIPDFRREFRDGE